MKYYTQARLFPTLLTSLPTWKLSGVILEPYKNELIDLGSHVPATAQTGLFGASMFLLVLFNRTLSIAVFQNWFFHKDELHMPTTSTLLWSNQRLDLHVKRQLRKKIETLYGLELLSDAEEAADEITARKRLAFAVTQIRNSLRGNPILLQHNIHYGFVRNLVGGSLIAVAISIGLLCYALYAGIQPLRDFALVIGAVYLAPVLLCKPIIGWFGQRYTKILLEQFAGIKA